MNDEKPIQEHQALVEMTDPMTPHEEFQWHLSNCEICSGRPLSLCPEGDRLLAIASETRCGH